MQSASPQWVAVSSKGTATGGHCGSKGARGIIAPMCFRITLTGRLLPLATRTVYDEVMLHCARIGYNP